MSHRSPRTTWIGTLAATCVAVFVVLADLANVQAAVPSSGLVAYWSFDDGTGTSAADGSGNGHTGTLTYGPVWAVAADCMVGGCVSLDGNDDYVRVVDAAGLRITGDVTISAWIKPTSMGTKQSVVSKRYEFELGHIHDAAPYPLKWSHKEPGGTLVSGDLTSSTDAGQWQHVVLVRDAAARQMRGYENGSPGSTSSYTLGPGTSSHNVNIGRNPGGSQQFRGLIDEVRIYNRVLSDAEVRELYDQGGTPQPPDTQAPSTPTNLVATAASSSDVDLSWTASSDDRGVAGYRVYRNGSQAATTAGTSYRDTALSPATTYSYVVAAYDAAGNVSALSETRSVTTPAAPPSSQREDVTIATGFALPTSMAMAPDGRIFVAEQGGKLRVVKNDALLSTPFLTVSVTSNNERGLLGVTFDPDFAQNGYVYVYYTAASSPVVNRVSRFTASSANPDVAAAGSEVVVLGDIPSQTGWHNGGAIHFGNDGKLYVAVGEGHYEDNAQLLTSLSGKLLRINADGSIPTDNPFYGSTTGVYRAIWALGLRNPFTFDIQPTTGRIFVNDVGENAWEEVNEAWVGPNNGSNAGFNFGWPTTEGPTTDPRFKTPFHAYPQANGDCAVTGGSFYNPSTVNFPAEYVGDYFFADYCSGWIKSIDLATKAVSTFLAPDGTRDPVDVKVAADGSLYYLARAVNDTPSLHRVRYVGSGQPPTIVTHPQSTTVPVGGTATFSVSASGSSPLSFQWQRNGAPIAGATGSTYTLTNVQAGDSSAQFRAVVTNSVGSATSDAAILTVTSNQPPTATIAEPGAGALYSSGETVSYSGSGVDLEDGALPASSFTWKVDFHHESHTHPFVPDTTGSQSGAFTAPTTGEVSADVWYRIYLTVRDSGGLTHTTYRDVLPRTATVTLASNVPGLQLVLDGQPVAAPYTFTGVVGFTRSLDAPSPQTVAGTTYEFVSWSDGGSRSHAIATPGSDTTYTATYQEAAGTPPEQGLVARWSFDEGTGTTAADGSGNGHTGTLTYGATWGSSSQCRLGRCVSLDGVNDYVKVLDAVALRITGDVTVAAWIKPTTLGKKHAVVSKRYEFELGPAATASPYPLGWTHRASGGTLVSGNLTPSTEAGQWQHVVLVRTAATRQVKGYKNGTAALVSSYTLAPATSSYNVGIGRHASGGQHFKGLIDEVRIYDRALTDAEVLALFVQA